MQNVMGQGNRHWGTEVHMLGAGLHRVNQSICLPYSRVAAEIPPKAIAVVKTSARMLRQSAPAKHEYHTLPF